MAVTFTEGGTDRVEVLVTLPRCHQGPCRFLVNVTRTGSGAFEDDFRLKLREALKKHPASRASASRFVHETLHSPRISLTMSATAVAGCPFGS